MLQSAFVYIALMLIMFLLSVLSISVYKDKNSILTPFTLIAIVLFSVVFGFRYNVGLDHIAYIKNYLLTQAGGHAKEYEPFFKLITNFFAEEGFHYGFYFSFIAFIQILFTFKAFKNYAYILPSFCLILFLGEYALNWMNGVRQCLAICVFYYALRFLEYRNLKKLIYYVFWVLIASLFHKSALLLLLLVIFNWREKPLFSNPKILISIYVLFFIFANNYAASLWENYSSIFTELGYWSYDADFDEIDRGRTTKVATGIGVFLALINNIVLIIVNKKVKSFYNSRYLNLVFDLYYISILFACIFGTIVITGRINMYFSFLGLILQSFTLYYFYKNCKTKLNIALFSVFLLIKVALFSNSIYKGAENLTEYHYITETPFQL